MGKYLTDTIIKSLPTPKQGNRITYDAGDKGVAGFGIRITAADSRAFILNYRTRIGRERRFTIGKFPDWKTAAAREEAKNLKQRVGRGEDPMADIEAGRDAKTVADLAARFLEDHSERKNRERTTDLYRGQIDRWILPKLKHMKVADVTFTDIDGLHALVTKGTAEKPGGPYAANRVVALLSKMFSLSIRWGWRADNPARGVERNQEEKREAYLTNDEIVALSKALAEHKDQKVANVLRLLLLTGARKSEVLKARWEQFDLEAGVWTKPSAHTKQKKAHRVPLSAPARLLLSQIKTSQSEQCDWVFPGRFGDDGLSAIARDWEQIRAAVGGKRVHDLRHTYASILASSGLSLPIIGALLGHTQPATTARYAHLFDDPLRAATDRVGAIVDAGKRPAAEVVEIRGRG